MHRLDLATFFCFTDLCLFTCALALQVVKPYNAHEAQGNAVLQVE